MRLQIIRSLFFLSLLSLVLACDEEGNQPKQFGQLIGIISSEEGLKIDGAQVEIKNSSFSRTIQSNYEGRYNFERIPVGEYELSISAVSYISSTVSVTIVENIVTERNVSLELGAVILEVDKQTFEANIKDGVSFVAVTSNASWVASTAADWINLEEPNGQGNRNLNFIYTANPGDEPREGIIEIKAGNEIRKVIIKQAAPINIKKITPIFGEETSQRVAAFEIEFTGPIKDLDLRPIITWCQHNFSPVTINAARTKITYSYSCGRAGGSYPFTIEYKDDMDNGYTKNIHVNYFDESLPFEGLVISTAMVPGKDQVWMLTERPSRLHFIDLVDFKLLKSIALQSEQPTHVSYNPFNQQVYVASMDGRIQLFNSTTGNLSSSSTLPPVPFQPHDNYYVHEMAFTTAGKAVMELYQVGSSGITWFTLDSQQGNAVANHPRKGWENDEIYETNFPRSNGVDKNVYFYGIGGDMRGLMKFDEQLNQLTTIASGVNDPMIRNMFMDRMSERFVLFDGDTYVVDKGNRIDLGFLGYSFIRVEFCRSCSSNQVLLIHGTGNHLLDFYDYGQKQVQKRFSTGPAAWNRLYHSLDGKYISFEANDYELIPGTENLRGKLVRISLESMGL